GAPKSFQWVHVKERIIERSQQELLETTNIHLGAQYIKKGRKITHIKFQFIEDEQQQLKLEN
ncbi:MAG: replication initiation protein, partial [Gammaproteobacteria bacterium]|nr:replication initiation protein [Gammaproteobacteria bacterium]